MRYFLPPRSGLYGFPYLPASSQGLGWGAALATLLFTSHPLSANNGLGSVAAFWTR